MKDYFQRVKDKTATRFWINNVTEEQADWAIAAGATGCTQNPAYTWKMLKNERYGNKVQSLLEKLIENNSDLTNTELVELLQIELVYIIAKKFMPLFETSKGKDGYVSIQGSPFKENKNDILAAARKHRSYSPNIMAKIPATPEGIEAIKILASEGTPINATECMAIQQVEDVCTAYMEGIEQCSNPAPMYFSLITGIYDEYMQKKYGDFDSDYLWQAGMIIAKKVHQLVENKKYSCGFIGGGARGLHHFTEMIGADAQITINWQGTADVLLEKNLPVVCNFYRPIDTFVVDKLMELPEFRQAYNLNGLDPEEYEDFGPVVLFRKSFEEAWKSTEQYIDNLRK